MKAVQDFDIEEKELGAMNWRHMSIKFVWFGFRYYAGSYDEALIKAEQALEIKEKELGARDERMAELYRLLAAIWERVRKGKQYHYFPCLRICSKNEQKYPQTKIHYIS